MHYTIVLKRLAMDVSFRLEQRGEGEKGGEGRAADDIYISGAAVDPQWTDDSAQIRKVQMARRGSYKCCHCLLLSCARERNGT